MDSKVMDSNAMDSNAITSSTLRFNFTDDIMAMITRFSKLHRFDDRHTYKEQWNKWVEEHKSIIAIEGERLTASGYKGEAVEDKMYKAGRYYFRKKKNDENNINNNSNNNSNNKTNKKRTYITMNKRIIEEMDNHIISSIRRQQANSLNYIPAKGYEEFCKSYEKLLIDEQKRLHIEYNIEQTIIDMKIKKTYKNRYFALISKE
jgi:hypothetical protein